MKKYEIVHKYIVRSIQTGNLQIGDRLPSIREMAKILSVSTTTVFEAYLRLEQDGIIISHERQGFLVADVSSIPSLPMARAYISDTISEISLDHFKASNQYARQMVRLGSISPPNPYFPSLDLSKHLSRVVRTNPREINTYGFPPDAVPMVQSLEKSVTRHMFKSLNISVPESEICLSNGASNGLLFVLSAMAKKGDIIAIESPGFIGAYALLQRLYLEPLEIKTLPPHGLDLDNLEEHIRAGICPRCIIVTPNFQNPTGSLMPLENRERLLALCLKNNIIVIEDDVLGALGFAGKIPTLKELMPENVIYLNSCSKILAPGYRVGWIAGGKYTEVIRISQWRDSGSMTLLCHLAVFEYLESVRFKPFIRRFRDTYQANCKLMSEILLNAFPKGTELFEPPGGQYIWLTMPKGASAEKLFYKAIKRNVLLAPGEMFSVSNINTNCLRFCFALDMTQDVIDAVEIVGTLAKSI